MSAENGVRRIVLTSNVEVSNTENVDLKKGEFYNDTDNDVMYVGVEETEVLNRVRG